MLMLLPSLQTPQMKLVQAFGPHRHFALLIVFQTDRTTFFAILVFSLRDDDLM